MNTQNNARLVLAGAIVLAAAIVCATLIALNFRVTYPLQSLDLSTPVYYQLLERGCTPQYLPGPPPTPFSVSCPLWVRP